MPAGPAIDPSLVLKIGLGLGGVLVILLIIWVAKSIFGGSHANPASAPVAARPAVSATAQPADTRAIITALDYVSVRVWAKGDEPHSHGEELLPTTVLKRGETAVFNKAGPVIIWASQQESIQIDFAGKHFVPGSPSNNVRGAREVQLP